MSITRTMLFLSVFLVGVLAMAPAAEACMGGWCCWSDGREIICVPCLQANADSLEAEGFEPIPRRTFIEFTSPSTVQVTLQDYTTKNLVPNAECITAVSPVAGVDDVTAVTNYDGRTFAPFNEVVFTPSEIAGREAGFAAFEDGESNSQTPWHGFLSHITGTVEDGVLNYFVLDIELAKGVSPLDFIRNLEKHGLFVTGSSTGGIPDDGHLHYHRLSDTDVFVKYPIPFAVQDEKPTRHPVGVPLP